MAEPESIFVSVVSDGDAPLGVTLRSAWRHAHAPSALHFGVVRRSDGGAPLPPDLVPPEQLALVTVPPESATPAAARALSMTLYRGEQWIVQLEAGAQFEPGWDSLLLAQAASLGNDGRWINSVPRPQGARALDSSWKKWLAQNLQRGCSPEELLSILLKHEFSLASARENMGVCFPEVTAGLGNSPGAGQAQPDYRVVARPPLLTRGDPRLRAIDTSKLQLYTLDDCLGEDECDALIEVINQRLRPSTVTLAGTDKHFRTSRTCDLSQLNDPLVAMIDEKIARTLGIRRGYAEPNQAQRYDVGQQFKAHTDYFEPGTEEFATFGGNAGNRTWTVMVYLNEGMKGGGTHFFAIDRTLEPKRGQAVIWNNLYPDGTPNPDTLHAGMPVTEGHKIIVTLWFRAMGSGPMFFES